MKKIESDRIIIGDMYNVELKISLDEREDEGWDLNVRLSPRVDVGFYQTLTVNCVGSEDIQKIINELSKLKVRWGR